MKTQENIKVIIAEADKSYRDIFKKVSENDSIKVVGEAATENELFKKLSILKPDVVIVDLFLISRKIKQTVNGIRHLSQFTKILVLSFDNSELLINQCLSKGVSCFCNKSIINGTLLQNTIKKMNSGQQVVLTDEEFNS